MVQCANYAGLLTSLPTVEELLDDHASELGRDLIAYRNHVYRVVNLCLAIMGDSRIELEKIPDFESNGPDFVECRSCIDIN